MPTLENVALILKYSGIYGIGAIGAAMIIGAGGIDLAPGAVIALASVVTGHLFVVGALAAAGGDARPASPSALASGALAAALVVGARLPPFIATLGIMGIARGLAFLITEGRFYDLSRWLAAGAAPLGVPLAGLARPAHGRARRASSRSSWCARRSAVTSWPPAATRPPRATPVCTSTGSRPSSTSAGGALAALSGVVLAVVQGQGKADLASGYELDIIAAAVVGGASLSGGRASVVGAVIGALIFGVLRNALAQIPGGTFADRLILGVAVLVIVVMDRIAGNEGLRGRRDA